MPYADADGARIHYEVEGAGSETLVLIMGLGGHASEWGEDFIGELGRSARVVRMDNRGIGPSETTREAWSMLDMANDARAVLDALGVERAHVLGTSMGGMIAQTLALEHPRRVARLILMSTSCGGSEAIGPADVALALFAPAPQLTLEQQRRRAIGVITGPGFAETHVDLVEHLVQLRLRVPTRGRVFNTQLKAIMESDRSQRIAQLRLPTLVIHGTDDSLVPVGNGKLLASRIPAARLVLLPGCGHLPHLEQPLQCARLVGDFLAAPG